MNKNGDMSAALIAADDAMSVARGSSAAASAAAAKAAAIAEKAVADAATAKEDATRAAAAEVTAAVAVWAAGGGGKPAGGKTASAAAAKAAADAARAATAAEEVAAAAEVAARDVKPVEEKPAEPVARAGAAFVVPPAWQHLQNTGTHFSNKPISYRECVIELLLKKPRTLKQLVERIAAKKMYPDAYTKVPMHQRVINVMSELCRGKNVTRTYHDAELARSNITFIYLEGQADPIEREYELVKVPHANGRKDHGKGTFPSYTTCVDGIFTHFLKTYGKTAVAAEEFVDLIIAEKIRPCSSADASATKQKRAARFGVKSALAVMIHSKVVRRLSDGQYERTGFIDIDGYVQKATAASRTERLCTTASGLAPESMRAAFEAAAGARGKQDADDDYSIDSGLEADLNKMLGDEAAGALVLVASTANDSSGDDDGDYTDDDSDSDCSCSGSDDDDDEEEGPAEGADVLVIHGGASGESEFSATAAAAAAAAASVDPDRDGCARAGNGAKRIRDPDVASSSDDDAALALPYAHKRARINDGDSDFDSDLDVLAAAAAGASARPDEAALAARTRALVATEKEVVGAATTASRLVGTQQAVMRTGRSALEAAVKQMRSVDEARAAKETELQQVADELHILRETFAAKEEATKELSSASLNDAAKMRELHRSFEHAQRAATRARGDVVEFVRENYV